MKSSVTYVLNTSELCNIILQGKRRFRLSLEVVVHDRVCQRHPELEKSDVREAWSNCIRSARRTQSAFDDYVAVGFDKKGRLLQMIAVLLPDGVWMIYHAFSPPTKKVLKELGMLTERKQQ